MKKKCTFISITFVLLLFIISCNATTLNERRLNYDVYFEGENIKGLKESQILEKINGLKIKINRNIKDAKLNDNSWDLDEGEEQGVKVNDEKTLDSIFKAKEGEKVSHVTEILSPNITAKTLSENIVEIGKFTTTILDQKQSRVNNIEIASECLNNEKILPGEVFSFNDSLGKRTKAKGYEMAPIIIKTENGPQKGSGRGGGICQLSSTLYKAAHLAGMEIIERHSHSKQVGYLPLGQDATVSYGSTDFKFKNNRDYPIMIKTAVVQDKLIVRILENKNKT
jgi:vancomycin resistance protein YoaR